MPLNLYLYKAKHGAKTVVVCNPAVVMRNCEDPNLNNQLLTIFEIEMERELKLFSGNNIYQVLDGRLRVSIAKINSWPERIFSDDELPKAKESFVKENSVFLPVLEFDKAKPTVFEQNIRGRYGYFVATVVQYSIPFSGKVDILLGNPSSSNPHNDILFEQGKFLIYEILVDQGKDGEAKAKFLEFIDRFNHYSDMIRKAADQHNLDLIKFMDQRIDQIKVEISRRKERENNLRL